jgi:hypothetical protein
MWKAVAFVDELHNASKIDWIFLFKGNRPLLAFKESVLSQSSCKERDIDDLILMDEELRRIASLWPNKETDDW